jgi:hypothetical protein
MKPTNRPTKLTNKTNRPDDPTNPPTKNKPTNPPTKNQPANQPTNPHSNNPQYIKEIYVQGRKEGGRGEGRKVHCVHTQYIYLDT